MLERLIGLQILAFSSVSSASPLASLDIRVKEADIAAQLAVHGLESIPTGATRAVISAHFCKKDSQGECAKGVRQIQFGCTVSHPNKENMTCNDSKPLLGSYGSYSPSALRATFFGPSPIFPEQEDVIRSYLLTSEESELSLHIKENPYADILPPRVTSIWLRNATGTVDDQGIPMATTGDQMRLFFRAEDDRFVPGDKKGSVRTGIIEYPGFIEQFCQINKDCNGYEWTFWGVPRRYVYEIFDSVFVRNFAIPESQPGVYKLKELYEICDNYSNCFAIDPELSEITRLHIIRAPEGDE